MLCNKMSRLNRRKIYQWTLPVTFPLIALALTIAGASPVANDTIVTEDSIAIVAAMVVTTQTSVEITAQKKESHNVTNVVELEDEEELKLKGQCVDILSFDESRKFIKLCPKFITPPGCTTTKEDRSKKYPACCPETICP